MIGKFCPDAIQSKSGRDGTPSVAMDPWKEITYGGVSASVIWLLSCFCFILGDWRNVCVCVSRPYASFRFSEIMQTWNCTIILGMHARGTDMFSVWV